MAGLFNIKVDDDFVDRLHHFFTCILLFLGVIISSKRQYLGEAISCWTPKEYTRAHVEYAENICWTTSTYWLHAQDRIPRAHADRKLSQITYYQWIPFVLMAQAILIQLPNTLWVYFHERSGFHIKEVIELASEADTSADPSKRRQTVRLIAAHLYNCLEYLQSCGHPTAASVMAKRVQHLAHKYFPFWRSQQIGTYLSVTYCFCKLLSLANAAGMLFLMNSYLRGTSAFYGLSLMGNMSRGVYWEESGAFPRVSMCDFQIRVLGNLHTHSLQCVLPINRLNEKIYALLWFWFSGLCAVTAANMIQWWLRLFCAGQRRSAIHNLLEYVGALHPTLGESAPPQMRLFLERCLRLDGVFMAQLLTHNVGRLFAGDVVCRMWNQFERRQHRRRRGVTQLPRPQYAVMRDSDAAGSSGLEGSIDRAPMTTASHSAGSTRSRTASSAPQKSLRPPVIIRRR